MSRTVMFRVAFACALTLMYSPMQAAQRRSAQADAQSASVKHGEYLVKAIGCNDCHTPFKMGANGPEPDMSRMLSGHPAEMKMPPAPALPMPWTWAASATNTAFSGPWGVSFTANLTPDKVTGLGNWTEEMFIAAMRTGKHMGRGRPILPPMPWPAFKNLNDSDLHDLFTYLRTLPPMQNRVPDPIEPPESKGH